MYKNKGFSQLQSIGASEGGGGDAYLASCFFVPGKGWRGSLDLTEEAVRETHERTHSMFRAHNSNRK